uniref:Reverse transcriptase zinc-binding domain-containing protein n=1 Tax=Ananas comosus var. bracteatus TaxID=296719 RepID=A0A6V7PH48_ANACO|nr:unnamed protein product [Ananas comosus var. bracteatus]
MLSMRHVLHGAFEQMREHTRWKATSTGRFTLSSAISYMNRQQSSSLNHGISARTQVGIKLAERIPHFEDSWPLYQEQSETRDHLFFHCPLSQQVWFASQVEPAYPVLTTRIRTYCFASTPLESNINILIGWSSRYSSFSQRVDKLAK